MKRFNEITLKKYLCNDRFNAYNDTGKNSYERFTRATRCKKLLRLERYTLKNVTQKYICRTTLLKASVRKDQTQLHCKMSRSTSEILSEICSRKIIYL